MANARRCLSSVSKSEGWDLVGVHVLVGLDGRSGVSR